MLTNSHPFLVGPTPVTYTAQYVNRPPVAVATATPLGGNTPLTVAFNGAGSSDPEFGTLTYSWSFGDGGVSTLVSPVRNSGPGTCRSRSPSPISETRSGAKNLSISVSPASPLCGNGRSTRARPATAAPAARPAAVRAGHGLPLGHQRL